MVGMKLSSLWIAPLALASFVSMSNVALADVPSGPSAKCKCSTPGGESAGALAAVLSAAGLASALLLRKRKKS